MVRLGALRTKGYADLPALLLNLFVLYPSTAAFVQTLSLYKIPVHYSAVMNLLKFTNLEAIKVQ
jgi:hypothetical protein